MEFIKEQIIRHHIDYHYYQYSPDKDFKTDWDEELKKMVSYIAHLKNKIKVIEYEIRNDINKKDNEIKTLHETIDRLNKEIEDMKYNQWEADMGEDL